MSHRGHAPPFARNHAVAGDRGSAVLPSTPNDRPGPRTKIDKLSDLDFAAVREAPPAGAWGRVWRGA